MKPEEVISQFLREAYDDEHLAMLREHAASGKLSFLSCCCLKGIATASGKLNGYAEYGHGTDGVRHFARAAELPGSLEAEQAFCNLIDLGVFPINGYDESRRAKLLPIIDAEISRRAAARKEVAEKAKEVITQSPVGILSVSRSHP